MENTENLKPQESLQLINEMIERAKQSFSKISFYFLFWGILLTVAGVVEYFLDRVIHYKYSYIGWPVLGVIGFIVATIKSRKEDQSKVRSYAGRIFGYLWGGFGLTLVLLIVATVGTGLNPGSFIIILTGLPTFVTGGVMRFRPLIIGGIVFWVIGILSFFFLGEFRSLIFSFAIVCGYIIPGLMLKKSENR